MYDVLEKVELEDETLVEVLQFSELNGSADVSVANTLYFASNSVMRLKMIRITLYNSFARIEPGSLYFMKGNLENKTFYLWRYSQGIGKKSLIWGIVIYKLNSRNRTNLFRTFFWLFLYL